METYTSSERQILIHPECHVESDQINSIPGEKNENDQGGENNIKETGVHYLLILSHVNIFILDVRVYIGK